MKQRRVLALQKIFAIPIVLVISYLILVYDLLTFLLGMLLMTVFIPCNMFIFGLNELYVLVFGKDAPILPGAITFFKSLTEWANRMRNPYKKEHCNIKPSKTPKAS